MTAIKHVLLMAFLVPIIEKLRARVFQTLEPFDSLFFLGLEEVSLHKLRSRFTFQGSPLIFH